MMKAAEDRGRGNGSACGANTPYRIEIYPVLSDSDEAIEATDPQQPLKHQPETVILLHHAPWRLLWRWRSRRPPGRPPIDPDLRELIRQMWRCDPTSGQKIISAELAKLGYKVVPRTVAKYRPSSLDRQRGQRWATSTEHVIGTLRRDCFDHLIVENEQHAERVLRDYVAYYHGRPHRGPSDATAGRRPTLASTSAAKG